MIPVAVLFVSGKVITSDFHVRRATILLASFILLACSRVTNFGSLLSLSEEVLSLLCSQLAPSGLALVWVVMGEVILTARYAE